MLLGLSGGVDSSVCAALIHKAIGNNLICVFVNHGLLRKGEFEQVQEVFAGQFGMNLVAVDAADRFLDKLVGVTNPEQKRKIIGEEFIRVFEEEAAKLGKSNFLPREQSFPTSSKAVPTAKQAGQIPPQRRRTACRYRF